MNYTENTMVYTTLPNVGFVTRAKYPDNWSECLFMGPGAKRAVLSTPGFPSDLPRPDKPSHKICETPTAGGLGMVATRDLKMGDLITSERPLFVTCCASYIPTNTAPGTPMAQVIQASLAQWEKYLECAFNRMTEKNQAAFRALANSHTEDGSGPLLGVVRTNGFGIALDKNEKGEDQMYSAIYDHLSRANHSCRPNAAHTFNIASFSGQLRAVRDVKTGEEIFVDYCAIEEPTAKRQKKLEPYGFQCACPSCTDPNSDRKLREILASVKGLGGYRHMTSRADEMRRLEVSLGWLKKIEELGLQKLEAYERHMEAVSRSSMFLGKSENFVKYGPLRSAWQDATRGDPKVLTLF